MKGRLNNLTKEDKELISLLEKDMKNIKKSSKKEPLSIEVVCTSKDIKDSFAKIKQ